MRQYDAGQWGLSFICSLRGSVIPKAIVWSLPAAILAAVLNYSLGSTEHFGGALDNAVNDSWKTSQVWAAYNFVIGFLVSFRSGKAYGRWWEGGTLLQQARGEWFNAYSSCIAFSTSDASRSAEVRQFHRLLATLMSMCFAAALSVISSGNHAFDVVDLVELDPESVSFLRASPDKLEVLVLWIQKLIVQQMEKGVVNIPAPVISRVFQELSRGVVKVNDVRKISEFPFPFPYAQLIGVMLSLNACFTPIIAATLMEKWYWAFCTCFVAVFFFTGLNYIAMEIERPFGNEENDLPMAGMQTYMNRTLLALLDPCAQCVHVAGSEREPIDAAVSIFALAPRMRRASEFLDIGPPKRLSQLGRELKVDASESSMPRVLACTLTAGGLAGGADAVSGAAVAPRHPLEASSSSSRSTDPSAQQHADTEFLAGMVLPHLGDSGLDGKRADDAPFPEKTQQQHHSQDEGLSFELPPAFLAVPPLAAVDHVHVVDRGRRGDACCEGIVVGPEEDAQPADQAGPADMAWHGGHPGEALQPSPAEEGKPAALPARGRVTPSSLLGVCRLNLHRSSATRPRASPSLEPVPRPASGRAPQPCAALRADGGGVGGAG